eukprot:990216-Alexandrium_andersonii.AAC.1
MRIGAAALAQRIAAAPRYARVGPYTWGPVATWVHLLGELGFHRVDGEGLCWTLDPGDACHPRKPGCKEWGLDMERGASERAHAMRNAWRRSVWNEWKQRSLRLDAASARATEAGWQPAVFKRFSKITSRC